MGRPRPFVRAQLVITPYLAPRNWRESHVFLNYAVWETLAAFKAAFGQPEFRERLAHYPASVVASPHLFEKLALRELA